MRSSILLVSVMVIVSGCTLPWSNNTIQKPIEYPKNQLDTPAAAFCASKWGTVTVEKNPSIPTMDLIFCTVWGKKTDAWQYMNEQTTMTGTAPAAL